MPGKLDEISAAIGEMRGDIKANTKAVDELKKDVVKNRESADTRHEENRDRLDTIERTLAPLAETVEGMKPIVDSYKMTRGQIAAVVSTFVGLVAALSYLVSHFGGMAMELIRKKIGGG